MSAPTTVPRLSIIIPTLDEAVAIDRLLDLFVFAPIGLALEARSLTPELAERGRLPEARHPFWPLLLPPGGLGRALRLWEYLGF